MDDDVQILIIRNRAGRGDPSRHATPKAYDRLFLRSFTEGAMVLQALGASKTSAEDVVEVALLEVGTSWSRCPSHSSYAPRHGQT
jgi:hypothetical protein